MAAESTSAPADRGEPLRLNIGCGTDYRQGYVNCDLDARVADVVFDLRRPPYPFEHGSVDEIVANQVLEHMPDLPLVMNALHDLLRVGGVLRASVPHFSSYGAMAHYDHYTTFHYNSFSWCDIAGTKRDMLHDVRLWRIDSSRLAFAFHPALLRPLADRLFNRHKNLYTTSALAYLFPARLIDFVFVKPAPAEEQVVRNELLAFAEAQRRAR